MPVSELHNLIRYMSYGEVSDRVAAYPEEARSLNSARATPIACLMKQMIQGTTATALSQNNRPWALAVQDAVASVLRAYPRGVANVDRHGDTALTIACSRAQLLRDANDARAGREEKSYYDILLRWAILRMIDACPEAASIADSHCQTPMQLVSNFGGGPLDIMKQLARAHPQSLIGPQSPIVSMIESDLYWDRVQPLLESVPMTALDGGRSLRANILVSRLFESIRRKIEQEEDRATRATTSTTNLVYRPRRISAVLSDEHVTLLASKIRTGSEEYYQKAKKLLLLLLRVGVHGTTAEELPDGITTFRALHAVASLKIPAQVVRLFAEIYPEQLGQVDEAKGWTPLHAASAAPAHRRASVWPEDDGDRRIGQGREDMDLEPTAVHILVQKFPAAASLMDRQGRFPLHLALKSGKTWATLNQVLCISGFSQNGVPTGGEMHTDKYPAEVEALVTAAPAALRVPDGISGLYPFQAAAAATATAAGATTNPGSSLDTTYELLRADPSVIGLAIHRDL